MSAIRTVLFERDAATKAKSVLDIREFDVPTTPAPTNWTALTRDTERREILLALVRQIDDLAAGRTDEIVLVLS